MHDRLEEEMVFCNGRLFLKKLQKKRKDLYEMHA